MAIPLRVYADTSVYGGAFDPEFAEHSSAFFDQVRQGRFRLVTSALVATEIDPAPEPVRTLFASLGPLIEAVPTPREAVELQAAYLAAGIVSERSEDDALHVALATVARCTVLVSWNFRHIVHFQKVPRYNAVNTLRGHPPVAIHSPREVTEYEEGL